MFRKLLSALLVLALLAPCCAFAAGAPNYLIPMVFSAVFNDSLTKVIDEGYADATGDQRREYANYFNMTYTEANESVLYYNNPDWSLETSFYYNDGAPGVGNAASVMNFVINRQSADGTAVALAAFILTLSTLDRGIDGSALFDWANGNPGLDDVYDLGDYRLLCLTTDDYIQYAVMPAGNVGGDGSGGNDAPRADAAALPATLIDRDGFRVTLTGVEINNYDVADVSLRFYTDIVNNTGTTINLFVEDVTVDGKEIDGIGCMNLEPTGEVYQDFFFFNSGESRELADILRNKPVASFTLLAQDDADYETLFTTRLTLDVSEMMDSVPLDDASSDIGTASGGGTAPGEALIDVGGFTVTPLWAERVDRGGSEVKLIFHSAIENYSGQKIDFYVTDVTVNGVNCTSFGEVDIPDGSSNGDSTFYFASGGDAAAADALRNPGEAFFTVRLRDSISLDLLYSGSFTIDLSKVTIEGD